MKNALLLMTVAVSVLLFALPSTAMMGSGHGHGDSGESSGESRGQPLQREPERQPSGHRHGDYYHSHEGGQLPHSHGDARPAQEAPKKEVTPPSARKKPATAEPAGKTPRKTTPASRPRKEAATKETAATPPTKETPATPATKQPSPVTPPVPIETSRLARDEVMMHLVRGNAAESAEDRDDAGRGPSDVGDFYMDETLVTNHQYTEFLNHVLPSIKVDNGVVWGNGQMWLLLGEVIEGYEPIVFQEGRFRVKGAHHAACAVLRVTAFGALAYARFHGESLPAEKQWRYALSAGVVAPAGAQEASGAAPEISGHGEAEGHGAPASGVGTVLPIPSPVMLYPANELGIRGLNANIGEWGLRTVTAPDRGGQDQQEYVVLGGALSQSAPGTPGRQAIRRYPWEAFADVGFRCVRVVSSDTKSAQWPGDKGEEPKPASR